MHIGIGIGLNFTGMGKPPPYVPVNLVQNSGAFDLWSPAGAAVEPNVAANPVSGQMTADRMIESAGTEGHALNAAAINFTLGTTYTFSVYAKYETAGFVQLLLGSGAFGGNAYGNFDIQLGAATSVGSSIAAATVSDAGDGWIRISITATATATATSAVAIFGANSGTMTRAFGYTGSISNTRLLANAQIEVGPIANPYVPG